ncbi:MAG: hypothetical protein ACETVN_02065 [Asgard group archaeon]
MQRFWEDEEEDNGSESFLDNETVHYGIVFGVIGLTVGLVMYSIFRKKRLEPEELGE